MTEFDKQAALKEANAHLAAATKILKELAANEDSHGYASTGGAADKMVRKAEEVWGDVYRWKRHGDHAAAMNTRGSR